MAPCRIMRQKICVQFKIENQSIPSFTTSVLKFNLLKTDPVDYLPFDQVSRLWNLLEKNEHKNPRFLLCPKS